MRWIWIGFLMVATYTAVTLLIDAAFGTGTQPWSAGFVFIMFLANSLIVGLSVAIVVPLLWFTLGDRIRDRPLAWALIGALTGSALMLAALGIGLSCSGRLCPGNLSSSLGPLLGLAAEMGGAGAVSALVGLWTWRQTRPIDEVLSRDVKL